MAIATQRLDPFHYLLEMAQQARREQMPTKEDQINSVEKLPVFRVRDLFCVLSPETTFSVGTAHHILPVPFVNSFISGMSPKDHLLLPVIDMSIILGSTTPLDSTNKSKLLFIEGQLNGFAILVDELMDEFLPKSLCHPTKNMVCKMQSPIYINAKLQYQGKTYLQLSCQVVERINDEY